MGVCLVLVYTGCCSVMAVRRKKVDYQVKYNIANSKQFDESNSAKCSCSKVCMAFIALCTSISVFIIVLPSPISPVVLEIDQVNETLHGSNSELRRTVKLFDEQMFGPEGFAVDHEGNIYTGLNDGRIIKFTDNKFTPVFQIGSSQCGENKEDSHCGRALGLEISPKEPNILYICDCYHGIIALNLKTKEARTIVNTSLNYPGIPPMKFINDLVILDNGSIMFTDTSGKFTRKEVLLEVFEGKPNGKLLHYNPVDKSLSIVIPALYFANGITEDPNEEFLLIAETTKARILKYHLKGPQAGHIEIFVNNMMGMPDNITPSHNGGYWVGFATLRNKLKDSFAYLPFIRNIIAKLGLTTTFVHLLPHDGVIAEYYPNGTLRRALYDMGGVTVRGVSEILDTGNALYLGSYDAPFIGKLTL